MLIESIGWALLLTVAMIRAPEYLMSTKDQRLLQQVVLAVGAGIYEEFVFRVILITGFAYILGLVFQWGEIGKNFVSIILASALFFQLSFFRTFWRRNIDRSFYDQTFCRNFFRRSLHLSWFWYSSLHAYYI